MHHIQDAILTVGSAIFSIALIPSIRGHNKPELSTSLMTGIVLLIYSVVYASLSLWFSATTTLINGCCWLTLAVQKKRQS